jgi:O-antigen/teichoic acid export membrane protein
MKTFAYLMVLQSLLMTLFIVAFVWSGFGVEGAVWGIVLSVVGGCIFGLYSSRKFLHLALHGLLQGAKRLVSFGSQVFVADALGLILLYTDIILIGYFLATEDVGYYSVAVSLSTFFLLVPQAIQRITFPATSGYWSQNNRQALSNMIDKSMKYAACLLLPLGLGVGFFARDIITGVFGQEFIHAAWPLCVLLIARVITGSTNVPIGLSFSGVGRPDIPLKLAVITAGANVGLNILLIPRWGILGAAIATTVSLLLGVIIFLALMPRILGVRIDIKWFTRAFGLACIGIALFLAGIRLMNPYVVGGVILSGYMVFVLSVLLTREDRAIFMSLAYSLVDRR